MKTTPVHAYSQGASPYGVLDMAGNVEEWTRAYGGRVGKGQTTVIRTGRPTGERIQTPGKRNAVCCGAARSTTAAGACGVPVAAGASWSIHTGASDFGW